MSSEEWTSDWDQKRWQKTCCHYLRGICSYGARCWESHPETGLVWPCTYGSRCKHNHAARGLTVEEVLSRRPAEDAVERLYPDMEVDELVGRLVEYLRSWPGEQWVEEVGTELGWGPDLEELHGTLDYFLLKHQDVFVNTMSGSHPVVQLREEQSRRKEDEVAGPSQPFGRKRWVPTAPSSSSRSEPNEETVPEDVESIEYRPVMEDYKPQPGDSTQLSLTAGTVAAVSWWQPEADGGHWAWGYILGDEGRHGYISARCLGDVVQGPQEPHPAPPSPDSEAPSRDPEPLQVLEAMGPVQVSVQLGPVLDALRALPLAAETLQAELQTGAWRKLLLQPGRPVQLLSAEGPWRPLSSAPCTAEELKSLAAALGLQPPSRSSAVLPGSLHRAACSADGAGNVRAVVIDIAREAKFSSFLLAGLGKRSLLLLGQSGSGKTTMLRDIAADCAVSGAVVVLDVSRELLGTSELTALGGRVQHVVLPDGADLLAEARSAITLFSPAKLLVDLDDSSLIFPLAHACAEAGVVCIASVRSMLHYMAHRFEKTRHDLLSPIFPFADVVELLTPDSCLVYRDAAHTVTGALLGLDLDVERRDREPSTGDVQMQLGKVSGLLALPIRGEVLGAPVLWPPEDVTGTAQEAI